MEGNGQWRFTPPVHTLLAFARALEGETEQVAQLRLLPHGAEDAHGVPGLGGQQVDQGAEIDVGLGQVLGSVGRQGRQALAHAAR